MLRHERTGAVSVNRRFAGGVRRPNWPVSALGRRRLSRRKPQPIALTSPKTADVGTWTVKRPAESGERKTATSRLRVGGSARVRSRGRCPKPRQHWRSGQKKAQPIRVGLWVNGGEEEDRTPDLRIANAALSQLSYPPTKERYSSAIQTALNGECRSSWSGLRRPGGGGIAWVPLRPIGGRGPWGGGWRLGWER